MKSSTLPGAGEGCFVTRPLDPSTLVEMAIPPQQGSGGPYAVVERSGDEYKLWHKDETAESLELNPPNFYNMGMRVWLSQDGQLHRLQMTPVLQVGCKVLVHGRFITIGEGPKAVTHLRLDTIDVVVSFRITYHGPATDVGEVVVLNPNGQRRLLFKNVWAGTVDDGRGKTFEVDDEFQDKVLLVPVSNVMMKANDAAYRPKKDVRYGVRQYCGLKDQNNAVIELVYRVSADNPGKLQWARRVVLRPLKKIRKEVFVEYGASYWLTDGPGEELEIYRLARSKLEKRGLSADRIARVIDGTKASDRGLRFGNRSSDVSKNQGQFLGDVPKGCKRPAHKPGYPPGVYRSWSTWLDVVVPWATSEGGTSNPAPEVPRVDHKTRKRVKSDTAAANARTDVEPAVGAQDTSDAEIDAEIVLSTTKVSRSISNGQSRGECVPLMMQTILDGDFSDVNAEWAASLMASLDSWRVAEIPSKGKGLLAATDMTVGTYVCVYGGKIFDVTKRPAGAGSHVLQLKETAKDYAVDGQHVASFPKHIQGAFANDAVNPTAEVKWMNPRKGPGSVMFQLFRVPVLKLRRDLRVGEEITIAYSSGALAQSVAY